MTPSEPRCLRHTKIMASCPTCITALRAKTTAARAATRPALTAAARRPAVTLEQSTRAAAARHPFPLAA